MLKKVILASLTVAGVVSVQAAEDYRYVNCFSIQPDVPGASDNWGCNEYSDSGDEVETINPLYAEYQIKVDNILDETASVHADIRNNDPMLELLYKNERKEADHAFQNILRFYSIVKTITEDDKKSKLDDLVSQLSEKKELEAQFSFLRDTHLQLIFSSDSFDGYQ